jgi:hypothetical protein
VLEYPEYQELSSHVLNLTDAFDRDEYIYIDFCHVSPNGNKIITRRIIDFIQNRLDSSSAPPMPPDGPKSAPPS